MSLLESLPNELLVSVASNLDDADRLCLRITCRKFRDLLAPPPVHITTDSLFCSSAYSSNLNAGLLSFLRRLFLPGNLFHDAKGKSAICVKCIKIQPISRFPIHELRIDGGMICKLCISWVLQEKMPPGHRYSWAHRDTYSCACCGTLGTADAMHEHRFWHKRDRNRRVCIPCHLVRCSDADCKGWPREFVERHRRRFFEVRGKWGDLRQFFSFFLLSNECM